MKKFLTILFAVLLSFSCTALFACDMGGNMENDGEYYTNDGTHDNQGNGGVKGSIDGDYSEVDSEDYGAIVERFDGVVPAAEDAEKAGGNARAKAKVTLNIGGKKMTATANSALDLILDLTKMDEDGIDMINGAALMNDMTFKADEGFSGEAWSIIGPIALGNEYPALTEAIEDGDMQTAARLLTALDNADVKANLNGYVKQSKIYTDAKVTGVPEGVKELVPASFGVDFTALANGIKKSYTQEEFTGIIGNIIASMLGLNGNSGNDNYAARLYGSDNPFELDLDDIDLEYLCDLLKLKVYSESVDGGIKVKIATTSDSKVAVETLLRSKVTGDVAEVIKNIAVSKLDMAIYLSLDKDDVLTAVAGNIDAKISASVCEKEVNFALDGALDCSFAVPESIEYPSFEGYVSPNAEEPAAA